MTLLHLVPTDYLFQLLDDPTIQKNIPLPDKISKLSLIVKSDISKFDALIIMLYTSFILLFPRYIISNPSSILLVTLIILAIVLFIFIFILRKNTNLYSVKVLTFIIPLFYSIVFAMQYNNIGLWGIFIFNMIVFLLLISYLISNLECPLSLRENVLSNSIITIVYTVVGTILLHLIITLIYNIYAQNRLLLFFEYKPPYFSLYTMLLYISTIVLSSMLFIHNLYLSYCNIALTDLKKARNIGETSVNMDSTYES